MTPHLPHVVTPIPAAQPVPATLDALLERSRTYHAEPVALGEVFDGYDGIRHDLFTTKNTENTKNKEPAKRLVALATFVHG